MIGSAVVPLTAAENARRQAIRNPAPSTCPSGHNEWGHRKNGKRYCKECNRMDYRRRKALAGT